MTTIKLFEQNSHLRQFMAKVMACVPFTPTEEDTPRWEIALSQTAFFPEGGGQAADMGTLGEARVLDVQEKGGRILHLTDAPLVPGEMVAGEVDWDHRFPLMQLHSAEHIVSGLVRKHHGFDNIGFHMGSDVVTIDFNGELTEPALAAIETLANEAVFANLPVEARYPEPESLADMLFRSKREIDGAVRVVTVPGYDDCACCGVHVKRTGEIGLVKLLSARRYKGGTRIEMVAGHLALRDYAARHRQITEISVALSAKPLETAQAVLRLQTENEALHRDLAHYREQRLRARAEELFEEQSGLEAVLPGNGRACIEEGLTPPEVRKLVMLLIERAARQQSVPIIAAGETHSAKASPGWYMVLSPVAEGGCLYAAGVTVAESMPAHTNRSETKMADTTVPGTDNLTDARLVASHLKNACDARGGGAPGLVQGSAAVPAAQVLAILRELPLL